MEYYPVPVSADGLLLLPENFRRRLRVEAGGLVVIREDQGRLVLERAEDRPELGGNASNDVLDSTDRAVRAAQDEVRRYVGSPSGVVDEFLAERRAAGARE